MPSRGIAARRARRPQAAGGIGVPITHGGRRMVAASAAVNRVVGIASGCVSDARRNRPRLRSLPRWSARVSAQPTLRKNLFVPVRVAMRCSFLRGAAHTSGSVAACAERPYGESSSVSGGGGGGVKGGRAVAAGFRRGVRKYVAAYCRPLVCGPIVVPPLRRTAQQFCQAEGCQERG